MRASFLDPRLAAVAAFVPAGSRVADVGSDHGRLACALLRSGVGSACIATEATPARLARLTSRVADRPEGAGVVLRCGDGLAPLAPGDRLDVVVVAGLGGPTIARILAHPGREALGARRFVLQPATDAGALRRWLVEEGLASMDERLVRVRGRFHVVIAAEPGPLPLPAGLDGLNEDDALEVGPDLLARRDPWLLPCWRETLARQRSILAGASAGRGRDEALRLRALAERVLAAMGEPAAPREDDPRWVEAVP